MTITFFIALWLEDVLKNAEALLKPWIIQLFTLGSIYSSNASAAEQVPETDNSNWTFKTGLRIPTGQLAIYKHGWGYELGTTVNKFN